MAKDRSILDAAPPLLALPAPKSDRALRKVRTRRQERQAKAAKAKAAVSQPMAVTRTGKVVRADDLAGVTRDGWPRSKRVMIARARDAEQSERRRKDRQRLVADDRERASSKDPSKPPRPTRERERKGDGIVERVQVKVMTETGETARIDHPYRIVDTIEVMKRRGTISLEMYKAGRRFETEFEDGQLGRLRGAQLVRVDRGRGDGLTDYQLDARQSVYRSMAVLGGIASPAGSAAWHILGEGMTLKEWAIKIGWSDRPLHQKTAAGILIGVLAALAARYGLTNGP